MTTNNAHTDHNQDLDGFLPLVASARDDGELSDLELAAVCLEIIRDPSLPLSCRETLSQWLDSAEGRVRLHSSEVPSSPSALSVQAPANSTAA